MAAPSPSTGSVAGYIRRPKNNQERGGPGMIRCFTNGEWKDRAEFSTRQLDRFKRSGASAANSQISCREHTAQVRRELKCEGPCGDWYPIEVFSRSTRSHNKTWCLHCTEWQLSVEPGYAPFNPPTPADLEEDGAGEARLLEAGGTEEISQAMSARIVDWIQQNPSENGDPEVATTAAMVGSAPQGSVAPITCLLDQPCSELDLLPVALSAANANRADNGIPTRPSYATVASTASNTAVASVAGLEPRQMQPASAAMGTRGYETHSVQQPLRPPTAESDSSGDTARALVLAQPAAPAPGTAWVETEFSALAISNITNPANTTGWARPNQRRTDLVTPRYVANSRGTESQPLSTQRLTYAEDDEDDSGDEC